MRASTIVNVALLCTLMGCTTTATQFLVLVDTDLPAAALLSITTDVSDEQGHRASTRLGTHGPGDAGLQLPFSFGVTPGEGARNGTVHITVTATLVPIAPGSRGLAVSRRALLTFVPGLSQHARIFLSRACSVVATGCRATPAAECTRSALCEESSLTCDDTGNCVAPTHVEPQVDGGVDASVDTCVPHCAGRACGDDGCGATCGVCASGEVCDANGRCAATCGLVNLPCCSGLCADATLNCIAGMCSRPPACGAVGQSCCAGATCTQASTVCDSTAHCVTCGGDGMPCCTGSSCATTLACDRGTCQACGRNGSICCPGSVPCLGGYCHGNICFAVPRLTDPGPEGAGCFDFATAHAAADWVVRGRPGATGVKYTRHISCSGSRSWIPPGGCFTIGADGTFSGTISNPVLTDCTQDLLGQWSSYVVVDGQTSSDSRLIYFNSMCPGINTCTATQTFCPPAPANGPGLGSCP